MRNCSGGMQDLLLPPAQNSHPLAYGLGTLCQHTNLHDFGQDGLVEVVLKGRSTEVPLVHLLILILQEDTSAQPKRFQQVLAAVGEAALPRLLQYLQPY